MQQNPGSYRSGVSPVVHTNEKKGGWIGEAKPDKGLIEVVASFIKKEITVSEFDNDLGPSIWGMVVEFDDRAEIHVNRTLNFCWRRFVVAKELIHLLLNKANSQYRTSGADEIENLVIGLVTDSPALTMPLSSEFLAYIGAMELLMPQELAQNIFPLADGARPLEVAHNFKCPEQVIVVRNSPLMNKTFQDAYKSQKYKNAILSERSRRANKPKGP